MSTPVTARCSICARPRGHGAPASTIQTAKHAAEKTKRSVRKPNGGACGIASRAAMKPVDQMPTKSQGIARTKAVWCAPGATVRASADTGADFRQCLLEVVDHRPDRQHRRAEDEHRAPGL